MGAEAFETAAAARVSGRRRARRARVRARRARASLPSGPTSSRRVLAALDVETTVRPTRHPVVDIVYFQLLTIAEASFRELDPDAIGREAGSPLARATGESYPSVDPRPEVG